MKLHLSQLFRIDCDRGELARSRKQLSFDLDHRRFHDCLTSEAIYIEKG